MAKKSDKNKDIMKQIARSKGQTGGVGLPGKGRSKIHEDNTKLKKRDRQDWKKKLDEI